MRDIKFRAWHYGDGNKGRMRYSDGRNGLFWGVVDNAPYFVEVMQFTGLTDKNGVEIYEGDIVAIQEPTGRPWSVEFDCGSFIVYNQLNSNRILTQSMDKYFIDGDGVMRFCAEFTDNGKDDICCEVIGNIYESPKLMEG